MIGSLGSIGISCCLVSQLGTFIMPVPILSPRKFLPAISTGLTSERKGTGRTPFRYFCSEFVSSREVNPRDFSSAKAVRQQSRQQRCVARSRTRAKAPALCKTASGVVVVVMVLLVRQSQPTGTSPDVTP